MTDIAQFRVALTCTCGRKRRVDYSLAKGENKSIDCPCGLSFEIAWPTAKRKRQAEPEPEKSIGKAALRKAKAVLAHPNVFMFCESSTAGALSSWHIRCLSVKGPKFGGGADTPFLCNRDYLNAWDIRVQIDTHHLQHACKACVENFKKSASPV